MSTIILYRLKDSSESPTKCNFEVFLIQRAKNMKFLGGVYAFPGGKVENEDFLEKTLARCKGLNKNQAHQTILDKNTQHQDENYSLGFWITGIREVFEEIGVLFAYDMRKNFLNMSDPTIKRKFEIYREQLLKKKILFSDIIKKEDLYYAVDKIHYFCHYITPKYSTIRYDTRFFIAEIPLNQTIKPDTREIISYKWADPTEILNNYRKKEIMLVFPQYACISTLQKVVEIKDFCNSL
ncbi:MAG: hypothetical protein ACFFD2_03905 [Promethearchaeota archaeon]